MTEKSKEPKSIQSYLDEVTAKTGKTVEDFRQMAEQKGIKKTSQLVQWLSSEYGLGYHQAGAINYMLFHAEHAAATDEGKLDHHFAGNKALWREPCQTLLDHVRGFGDDVAVAPNTTYINLQRRGKKFALLQTSASRLDVGLKLKGHPADGRLESAGSWNTMVTHRVRIGAAQEIDTEVIAWLQQAYAAA